ncbi:TPA: type-F conjugative transfer system secretin TraK [Escherichia coli]
MRKNNTAIIFGGLFFSCSVMAANGTLAPTVVPMVNGGQASIAISNTSPNLFTVPGDRIIAVNSLDGALTNNEQTASGGVVVATVNKKPFIRDNEGRVFARQGEVMNPLQYVPFNQTLYFINGDDPAQVAWMKRQTPPTLESKIILVQGSIPEMQKSLDSRVYFDQNGVLCQRLGIDQVPARVSAVPGDRFLKVEFIPAEEGRK